MKTFVIIVIDLLSSSVHEMDDILKNKNNNVSYLRIRQKKITYGHKNENTTTCSMFR